MFIKGEKKVEVKVTRVRLFEVSEFFVAGCSSRWASGREGAISFKRDPKVFSLFLAWEFDGAIENSEDYIVVEGADIESQKESPFL